MKVDVPERQVPAINYNNQILGPVIQPKTGEKKAPAINPASPRSAKVEHGWWTGFEQVLAGINKNPQLSFLRGEYLQNMPLGELEAINLKGGKKAGIGLNIIS